MKRGWARGLVAVSGWALFSLGCGGGQGDGASSDGSSSPQDTPPERVAADGGGGGKGQDSGSNGGGDDAGPDGAGGPPFGSTPLPATFTKRMLDLTRYPDARCNDGTAAGYYLEAGKPGTTSWVVVLGGGSWCSTSQDCAGRPAGLKSSTGWPATIAPNGILSAKATDNPNYAQAHRISVPYCTSDVFSGDTGPVAALSNFQFRGRKVMAAVIDDLRTTYGLGQKGQRVLFGGLSAGGVSVLANADRVHKQIPEASLFALVDAGFHPDVPPLAGPTIVQQFQTAMAAWNGMPNEACIAKNPGMPHKCYLGQYAEPEISIPVFFGQNLKDPNGALHCGGFTLSATPTRPQIDWYNKTYIPTVASLLAARAPKTGAFSPCKQVHTMADGAAWTTFVLAGKSYGDDVATFQLGGATAPRAIEVPCTF